MADGTDPETDEEAQLSRPLLFVISSTILVNNLSFMASLLASGEVFECETRVRRSDAEYRWMFHRKVPLQHQLGNILNRHGSCIDAEDRTVAVE